MGAKTATAVLQDNGCSNSITLNFDHLLGGAVVWPLVARAQQGDRMGRLRELTPFDENDRVAKLSFLHSFKRLRTYDGRMTATRGSIFVGPVVTLIGYERSRRTRPACNPNPRPRRPLPSGGRTIPIVFVAVSDPVASGIVARLDRPSGNITGFAIFEATLEGKWLELLSEIVPGLKRAAIMANPDTAPVSTYIGHLYRSQHPVRPGNPGGAW